MSGWFLRTTWLVLVTALVLTGCRQERKEGVDVLACGPDLQTLTVPPDYASGAIVAAGGLQEWVKTKKLELDGVVTLHQGDGSVYLTEQRYEIYPWSNSIRVWAVEPQGEFICELSQDSFRVLAGAKIVDALPAQVSERDLADAILTITTASVRFLDGAAKFTKASEPAKMRGLWYYPIERAYIIERGTAASDERKDVGLSESYWSKVIFYQDRDNFLVDMLWFADFKGKKFLAVYGYDYSQVQKKGVLLPAKIEIFKTDVRGALPQRVAQVNFK
ncbi:MAG: hypothetical protein NTX52_08085 [Planctomycetota bacterium]|nr:hypothetical protein [Planctomycetota bacterium]